MKKPAKKKMSVADRITTRLERFVDVVASDKNVSDEFTCRTVVLNLQPGRYDAPLAIQTRKLLGASQAIFAQFLGVKPRTVQAWEQGTNMPSDMACRFMDEIRRNPTYWRKRLGESMRMKEPVG